MVLMFALSFCISLCVGSSDVELLVKGCCVHCSVSLPCRTVDYLRVRYDAFSYTCPFAAVDFEFGGHPQLTRQSLDGNRENRLYKRTIVKPELQ